MLIDSGEKVNKFYEERLKYLNEPKYELERNSKLLKEIEEKNYLFKKYENLEKDNKKLSRDVELKQKNNISYIDMIFDLEHKIKEDQAKIRDLFNKFENNIEANMDNLDKKVTDEENKMSAKLNK